MYHLISLLILLYIYLIIYRGRTKTRTEGKSKGTNRTGRAKEERRPGRRMPPTSSPVPRLSSCSVCCLKRPHHRQPLTLTPSHHHRREGQPPRPVLSDVIATISPPIDQQTAGQRLGCRSSCPPRPRPLPLFPSPPCRGASAYWRHIPR